MTTHSVSEERGARSVAPVEEIRARFPALERRHAGRPVAYFDGPGGTQVPREVADAMTDYLFHHNANTHWRYPTSEETDALIAASREAGFAEHLIKPVDMQQLHAAISRLSTSVK